MQGAPTLQTQCYEEYYKEQTPRGMCVWCSSFLFVVSLETLNSCIEHEIGWGLYCCMDTLLQQGILNIKVIENCDFQDTQFRDSPHMLCRKDNKSQSIPMVTPHMLLIFIQMAEVWAIAKVYHIIGFHHTHANKEWSQYFRDVKYFQATSKCL